MTTKINTITSILGLLSDEQLQTIEAYAAYFCRQNLANTTAALPNTHLAGVGLYINAVANSEKYVNIPRGPPPAPVLENAVPAPFHPDLLPPLFPDLPATPQQQSYQHPQLKSPEPEEPCGCVNCAEDPDNREDDDDYYSHNYHEDAQDYGLSTCPGCRSGEWRNSAHTGPEGCRPSTSYNFIIK